MSWSDRVLAAESVGMLAAARILVKTARGKRIVLSMGARSEGAESENAARSPQQPNGGKGARVGAMLERVSRFTWWRSMCLEKALAGKWMLRRRGIASTMYLGMAKQGERFIAHAWLVGEGQTLTGAGDTVYATLAAFREVPPSGPRGANLKNV
jgi:hypothetical protein